MDNNGEAVTSVILTVTLSSTEGKGGNGIFSRCQFIDTQHPESLLLDEVQQSQMVPLFPFILCDRILWIACMREAGRASVENKSDHESLLCARIAQQANELDRLQLERDAFKLRAQFPHLTNHPLRMLTEAPAIPGECFEPTRNGETVPGGGDMGLGKSCNSSAQDFPSCYAETRQDLKQQLAEAQQLLGMSRTPSAMSDATVRQAEFHPYTLHNNNSSTIHPHSPSSSRRPVTSLSGNRAKFVPTAQRMKTHSSSRKQGRQQEEHEAMLTTYLRELEVMIIKICVVEFRVSRGWWLDWP
ncbi:hypothetical protein BCR43DRAFT_40624 [Syncephalastrum racemosum]|uniref:Uncharacterized protein n=1 Tax=Syncephalastrum racemosum TaxID=13706 RepID=A0A1X2HUH7_SYNRA|nr:hypothetical protein BCR43DRAFT_40624 [Syncephalastrum racemosum]